MVIIRKLNEVYVKVLAEPHTLEEIHDAFSILKKDAQFDPRFKKHQWNGKIALFNKRTQCHYIGILPELVNLLKERGYEYKIEGDFGAQEFSEDEALEFIKTLNLPENFKVRDYQLKYFIEAVRNKRAVCLSPTNSGKSLIIYLIYRYFNGRTLLCVPTIALVTQMFNDFKSYGYDSDTNAHMIMEGAEKETDKQLTIATWQSIYDEGRLFYQKYDVVIGDEAHSFQSKSLKNMMALTTNAKVRIGLTGTLTKDQLSNMTIKGLFGPIHQYTTQKELMDRGISSPLEISILELFHSNSPWLDRKYPLDYDSEIPFILDSQERVKFINNLAIHLSEKGNVFVMFTRINNGKKIYEFLKDKVDIPVFYVDGSTPAEDREKIRKTIDSLDRSITVCSLVFSVGIDIKKIRYMIFTHPSKSRIRVLQTIGRGLRKFPDKVLNIYDISDRLQENGENHTLKHMKERIEMYREEQFTHKRNLISI